MNNMILKISLISSEFLEENLNRFITLIKNEEFEYWGKEEFLKELPLKFKLSLYGARGKEIVGYIIASEKKDMAYIHKFIVDNNNRACGIGTNLLRHFEDLCLNFGYSKIQLSVYRQNEKSAKFYFNRGFTIIDERFDKNQHDILLMEKEIV